MWSDAYPHDPERRLDGPPTTLRPRCACGRPVPATSLDGFSCAEHDAEITAAMRRHPAGNAIPARLDERYDPSPEPIDRSIQ